MARSASVNTDQVHELLLHKFVFDIRAQGLQDLARISKFHLT